MAHEQTSIRIIRVAATATRRILGVSQCARQLGSARRTGGDIHATTASRAPCDARGKPAALEDDERRHEARSKPRWAMPSETRQASCVSAWIHGAVPGGHLNRGLSQHSAGAHEVAHSVGELIRQRGCFRSQDTGGINDKNFRKLSPSALSSIWRT